MMSAGIEAGAGEESDSYALTFSIPLRALETRGEDPWNVYAKNLMYTTTEII